MRYLIQTMWVTFVLPSDSQGYIFLLLQSPLFLPFHRAARRGGVLHVGSTKRAVGARNPCFEFGLGTRRGGIAELRCYLPRRCAVLAVAAQEFQPLITHPHLLHGRSTPAPAPREDAPPTRLDFLHTKRETMMCFWLQDSQHRNPTLCNLSDHTWTAQTQERLLETAPFQ